MAAATERVEAALLLPWALLVSSYTCKPIIVVKNCTIFFYSKAPSHVQTIGVRRNGFGSGGKRINVTVNAFPITIPEGIIYHYDG